MPIAIATEVTPDLVEGFARLIPQLSKSNPPPTADQLRAIVGSPCTEVFVATAEDGTIIGVSTLAVFRIPTGLRAWIEDVVVDQQVENRGTGSALTQAMVARARELGCTTVDLTSRPSREAANHMYRKNGFEARDTNVYRKVLETD